jgi:hypothetical protein
MKMGSSVTTPSAVDASNDLDFREREDHAAAPRPELGFTSDDPAAKCQGSTRK